MYYGELISISVAVSWTACAMFAEVASKRMGSLPLNVVRMVLSLAMLAAVMWWFTGVPYPIGADADTWLWLSLSGVVGYVLGDFCLFNSYILIGSRYGQLLMTLAPPMAAIAGFALLGQSMSILAILGMVVTILGIALAIGGASADETVTGGDRNDSTAASQRTRGVLFGIGAAIGQGVGLVLSAKGLQHYEITMRAAESAFRNGGTAVLVLPFAATAIRAVTGLIGFSAWTVAKGQVGDLRRAVTDRRAMLFALLATVTGPFIGVSLSLMATLYTSAGIAQTIMATTPIMIILPTYLFFHQKVSWKEVVGAVVSVVGVTLFFV